MRNSLTKLLLLLAGLGGAFGRAVAQDALVTENIVFPADAGVLDVTKAPYNADNTGATDATAAIQAAINAARGFLKGKTVYLPNGTYLISNRLIFTADQALQRTLTFQGQSREGTLLKLQDNLAAAATNLAVLDCFRPATGTQTFTNSLFSTNIANLTIDAGVGNPGAIGISYLASNQGFVRNVLIRSSDPGRVGRAGIEMATAIPGPALLKNITIEGFSTGIRTQQVQYSLTLENITLRNQLRYGILNDAQTLCIRHLQSENTVPALRQTSGGESKGVITLIDSQLNGGDAAAYGIELADGFLFARNVTSTGYAAALNAYGTPVAGSSLTEYVSGETVYSLQTPQPKSLNLPVQETPEVPLAPLSAWVSVAAHGAVPGDGIDDTQAIQRALNSGASTIYFPNTKNVRSTNVTDEDKGSRYEVSGTLVVGPSVTRLVGMSVAISPIGALAANTANLPVFKFTDNGAPRTIVMENFRTGGKDSKSYFVEQASANTLVLRNISVRNGYGYRNTTGFGDVFLEDFHVLPTVSSTFNPYNLSNRPGVWITRQKVWARQLDPEQNSVNIVNDGGTLWILGLKTEWPNTLIETKNGGKTEVLGGLTLAAANPGLLPAFVNNNSSVSIAGFGEVRTNSGAPTSTRGHIYTNVVTETRGDVTANLLASQLPQRKSQQSTAYTSFVLPLYTGYATAPQLSAANVAVAVDADAGQCGAAVTLAAEVTGVPAPTLTYAVEGAAITSPHVFAVGTTKVTATATNSAGSDTKTFTVTVRDAQAPVVAARNLTVQLDAQGAASITADQVDNGSADNCGAVASKTLSQSSFDCASLGENTVTLTLTDAAGNSASAPAIVTVEDKLAPTARTRSLRVALDAAGQASITPSQVDNGSADNCTPAASLLLALSQSAFTCANLGPNTVTLTVTDSQGNAATETTVVTVEDPLAPTAVAQNVQVSLVNGTATITAAQVDAGSSDNCGITSRTLSKTGFTCADLGANQVTLTVRDAAGHEASATATVTVLGSLPTPAIAVVPGSKVYTGGVPTNLYLGYGPETATLQATGGVSYQWSPSAGLSNPTSANPVFTATTPGTFTYTVTATSASGCTATASVTFKVVDVRCGKGNQLEKVLVCHNSQTLCVAEAAVPAHLTDDHDQLGSCPNVAFAKAAPAASEARPALAPVFEAYPNPFTERTMVRLRAAQTGRASLRLYNGLGQQVASIYEGSLEGGRDYQLAVEGKGLAAGVYTCRLVLEGQVQTQRLVLVR